ncbi:hypothetical protein IJ425_04260 [bacterium]|nr:hypothetical protein [bacterium]
MAINLNDENLNMMNNSAIPEGWEIENNQEITKEQNLANSTIDIPEGWEIESEPSNVSSTMVEQPQMRETYLSAAPKYNLMDNIKRTLNWVNNVRLSAYQEGKNTTRISDLETKDMFGTISDDEKNELNILSNIQPNEYGIEKPQNFYKKEYQTVFNKFVNNPATFAKTSYVEALRMIPMMWETIKTGGVGGVIGGVVGAGVGAAGALATTKANVVPATIKGAQVGSSWGAKIAGSTKVAQLEMGLARNEIKKINQEIIEKGGEELSNAEINTLSIMTGAINGSLELISLKKILKTVPNGDKIIEYLEKGAIKEAIQDGTLRSQIKKISKEYREAILTETATEMLQETTNVLAERMARGLGKIDQSPLSEDVQRIIETGVTTFGATMFLGGATSSSKVATIYAKQEVDKLNEKIDENLPNVVKKTIYSTDFEIQKIKKRAQEFAKSLTPQEQAQYVEDNFDTLVETVNDIPSVQEIENEEKAKEEFNSLKNRLFVQNLNAGQEKDVAKYEADIMAQGIKSLARISKKSLKEAEDMMKLNIQNLDSQQAADVLQGRVSLEEIKPNFQDDVKFAGANENEIEDAQREWQEKGTESKYFKKWFGESKVVDEAGKPLVVYHGTPYIFEVFDTNKLGESTKKFDEENQSSKEGFFFTSDLNYADGYTGENGTVLKTYINMQNPYIFNMEEYMATDAKITEIIKEAKQKGHDGVIFKNIREVGSKASTQYVAFNPEQIKSVDNRGTFDAQNPNIFYQALEFKFVNEIKKNIQKMDKKVSDFQKMKIFEPIKHYFDVIKNVPVKNMTQKIKDRLGLEDNSMGAYDPTDKTIYLNYDLINEGESTALLHTFIHEAEHAKQKILLKFAYNNVENPNLSAQEKYQMHLFLKAAERNTDAINNLFRYIGAKGFKSTEEFDYKARDLYNKYKKAPMELMADNIALVMQFEIGDRNEEQIQDFRGAYRSILENGANEVYVGKRTLSKNWAIQNIRVYNERIASETRRISDTGILYQSANQNNILFQSAYHGTPHKFDEFSLDAIGTGEGAQAHGWGLYFAENKSVSEGYRKTLTGDEFNNEQYFYDGNLIEDRTKKAILATIEENGIDKVIQVREKYLDKYAYNQEEYETKKAELEWIKTLDENKVQKKTDKGQLFEVDIPESDVLLDEDKVISEQSKIIKKAFVFEQDALKEKLSTSQVVFKALTNNNDINIQELYKTKYWNEAFEKFKNNPEKYIDKYYSASKVTGKKLYDDIAHRLGSPKKASEKFNELGIKGITYDGRQDGRCYVIFDDKAVKVLNTFYQSSKANQVKNLVTGEAVELKFNKNIDDNKIIEPIQLKNKGPFELSNIPADNKKAIIKHLNLKNNPQTIKNNDGTAIIINSKTIKKSLSNVKISDREYEDFCNILCNIKEIFKTSYNILTHNDIKTNTSYKFTRYANIANINNKKYLTEFIIKDNGEVILYSANIINNSNAVPTKRLENNFSTLGTANYSIADVKNIFKTNLLNKYGNIKEHEDISFRDNLENSYYRLDNGDNVVKISKIEDLGEAPTILSGALAGFETLEVGKNYTILSNGKKQIVGPTLIFNGNKNGVLEFSNNKDKEYQKTTIEIKESELDNYRGRIYPAEFNVKEKIKEHNKKVSNFVVPQEPVERLIDTNKPLREILDEKRGLSTTRYNFDGTIKDNFIVLLKNRADKSTLLHEFAHVYLATLNMLAIADKSIKDELNTLNKWLDYRGGQYTEKQHEKFAKGFEAYVMSGKAPTYPLKRAFENFRVWLKDVYNSILFGENSSDFELDKETKEIFDNLLGDISVEVRNKRSKELIEKARANASLRLNNDYANKKKIQPNQLTDKQIRYRDAAYSIIWTALQNSSDKEIKNLVKSKQELYMILGDKQNAKKENKGVATRRETIEFVLREIGDVFSPNDGFLSEWGEFFSPELIKNGQDSEFAMQAYDVIIDKKYLYSDKNNNEFSEEDLNRIQYEYGYFIDSFKNDYSNRDIAMAAYWDWIEEVPEFIQQDYLDKWELTTNEIDRYENLTKFQKAKEDLKLYAATLRGRGDYSSQFAEFARAIFKRLDFMNETDKAKIFNTLKDFNSFRELERNLDDIMDYAQTIDDVSMRHQIADKIVFEIRKTTPEYINGRKKHLYDYQTNKLFIKLREINALEQEEAQGLYDALVNKEIERRAQGLEKGSPTIEDKIAEDFYDDIVNSFIQFKANGMYYNSNELLVSLLEKIQAAKLIGKTSRDAIDFEKKVNQKNWIDNCASVLEEHKKYSQEQKNERIKKVQEIAKELYSMEVNFDSLLYLMFNEKIRKKFTLDTKYAEVDARVGADRAEVIQKIMNVYRLKGRTGLTKLQSILIDMTKDKYKIKQRYANKEENDANNLWQWEEIELSRMEILYYYIQAKNPVSYQMLTDMGTATRPPKGQFNKVDFDELLKNLSDQEKLMGDILQLAAEKYYPDLNKYHIKKYHIDLGKTTCYFPRKSQQSEVNELDLFNQYSEKSINPSFEKLRTAGPSVRIAPSNPFDVLFSYMQKANTIIVMGEDLDLINKVFRDNDLADKIKTVHGQKVYKEFMQQVTENLYSGQTKVQSEAEGIISFLMNNVVLTPMMIKPQIAAKQVMGLINYGVGDEYVTSAEWFEEFKKCTKKPKETIDFMMQDGYTKDRLERANLNEALKGQTDNKLFSKTSLLTDWFTLNMRYGDTLNLSFGGKAYVDALIKKGYTKEQAFELYRKKTISDQQSSINSTLSNLQRNSKSNPFAKLVFAYQNTPHQYFRICADSIIKAVRGDMSKGRAIKNFFFYWYFTSFIFNMATSLSPLTLLMTGDDDELKADITLALLGPISCIPFFGETARAVFCAITQQEYIGNRDWFTRFNQAVARPIKKILDGDGLTWDDVSDGAKVISQGAAIPFEQGINTASGVGDIFTGDFGKGLLKVLGYSEYRANKVFGDN